ncbi:MULTISPECIES: hypothetical protein [Serratia]|uniref:hypothetical protein n=1 Tax=Serratia TaxID=613 RepID=UPI00102119FE|nr:MULTISPECIES: hypothetical protein [Serratia]TXE64923.1 hypothetical protein FOT59_25500 [Serratia nevei]
MDDNTEKNGIKPTAIHSFVYTLTPGEAANEIAAGYRYQDNLTARMGTSQTRWIWKILGLLGSTMDTMGGVMSLMPAPTPNFITQTIIFKNEADVIIIPYHIHLPGGHTFDKAPNIMFPGDIAICNIKYTPANISRPGAQNFQFLSVSVDPNIQPRPPLEVNNTNSTNFEISIAHSLGRMRISHVRNIDTTSNSVRPGNFHINYVGFRGRQGTTAPSFGIAMTPASWPERAPQTCGCTIIFTPLGLRAN